MKEQSQQNKKKLQHYQTTYEGINASLFCQIKHWEQQLFLREEIRCLQSKHSLQPLRVMGTMKKEIEYCTLWKIEQKKNKTYQFIHIKTDRVLTVENKEVSLQQGTGKPSQRIFIQNISKGKYILRDLNGNAFTLNGIMQLTEKNSDNIFFQLLSVGCFSSKNLQNTIQFVCTSVQYLNHCLDFQNSGRNNEKNVILWKRNYRMNQRWIFQAKTQGQYLIKNIFSNKYLHYDNQNKEIVVSKYPQKWEIFFLGEITALIYNKQQKMYLGHSKSKLILTFQLTNWIIASNQINKSSKNKQKLPLATSSYDNINDIIIEQQL